MPNQTRFDSTDPQTPAVLGVAVSPGDGVFGIGGQDGRGVVGISVTHTGVEGNSTSGSGVFGSSKDFDGVFGTAANANHAGVSGHNSAPGGGLAGFFEGNVVVTGTLTSARVDSAKLNKVADILRIVIPVIEDLANGNILAALGAIGNLPALLNDLNSL